MTLEAPYRGTKVCVIPEVFPEEVSREGNSHWGKSES